MRDFLRNETWYIPIEPLPQMLDEEGAPLRRKNREGTTSAAQKLSVEQHKNEKQLHAGRVDRLQKEHEATPDAVAMSATGLSCTNRVPGRAGPRLCQPSSARKYSPITGPTC